MKSEGNSTAAPDMPLAPAMAKSEALEALDSALDQLYCTVDMLESHCVRLTQKLGAKDADIMALPGLVAERQDRLILEAMAALKVIRESGEAARHG